MDKPHARFAANLRAARDKADISQERLAELCGVYRTEISLLERAGRAPRLGTLVKLACALEVSVESLCEGIAWDEEKQEFEFAKPPR
jgi:transcriptional regulator with XRE-family HTH domain